MSRAFSSSGKIGQLLQQDRSLDRIETAVHADPDVVVFVAAFSMDAQAVQDSCHLRVVREDRTAIAIAAKRFKPGRSWSS